MTPGSWHENYICKMRNSGGNPECDKVRIKIEEVHKIVLDAAKEYCNMLLKEQEMNAHSAKSVSCSMSREKLICRKEELEQSVIGLYKRYREGEISKESYLRE